MNIDLKARRQKAEEQFNALVEQKAQKERETSEIDAELARLQGEYRAYTNLIDNPKAKNISKEANAIDIKEPSDVTSTN